MPPRKSSPPKRFTMGRAAFGKVSAVEGIHLTPDVAKDFGDFDRKALSPKERRAILSGKYGVKR